MPAFPIVLEYVSTATEFGGSLSDFVLKPISASEAFRKYNWLKGEAALNQSGNLRGMVVNAQMRTVFDMTEKAGSYLGLISALLEVGKEMSRIEKVYGSKSDAAEKGSRILFLSSAAVLRSVTSVVPTAVHLLSMSIEGYAQLYSFVSGSSFGKDFSDKVEDLDKRVTTIHSKQWDGEAWYNVVTATMQ